MMKKIIECKKDITVIGALIIVGVLMGALLLCLRSKDTLNSKCTVSIDGEIKYVLPLSEDAELTIGEGESINHLIIKNGRAYIDEASCPDKLCVKMGSIEYGGQSLICLPNRVVVSIAGKEAEIDGKTW